MTMVEVLYLDAAALMAKTIAERSSLWLPETVLPMPLLLYRLLQRSDGWNRMSMEQFTLLKGCVSVCCSKVGA
jgi:hypothetical protein